MYDDLALWQTCDLVLLKGATLILASPYSEAYLVFLISLYMLIRGYVWCFIRT